MKLYWSVAIGILMIIMSIVMYKFLSALRDILIYGNQFDYGHFIFPSLLITILSFLTFENLPKKNFAKLLYVSKYREKNSFGMKKIETPETCEYLIMSTSFYYSFYEYIEIDLISHVIKSNYLFFTIYEEDKLFIYYEPFVNKKKIMEVIENELSTI